jgi:hypothetical protein
MRQYDYPEFPDSSKEPRRSRKQVDVLRTRDASTNPNLIGDQ